MNEDLEWVDYDNDANVGEVIKFEGRTYKKVKEIQHGCSGCITEHGTELCYYAGDCSGIVLHKFLSFIETFKQL